MSAHPTPPQARSRAWGGVCAALLLSMMIQPLFQGPWTDGFWHAHLDWQPKLAGSQPWRWWTPVVVHLSAQHWVSNALGVVLVGSFGWTAGLPRQAVWAWCLAWPLTHLALLLRPELLRYGGASGVLHAGVAVTATWLVFWHSGKLRLIGTFAGLSLILKVLSDAPWGPVVQHRSGWDFSLAPIAHATGALTGVVCSVLMSAWLQRQKKCVADDRACC